jgi:hypothetical protein
MISVVVLYLKYKIQVESVKMVFWFFYTNPAYGMSRLSRKMSEISLAWIGPFSGGNSASELKSVRAANQSSPY